jgi:alpha-L-rhamnosidase
MSGVNGEAGGVDGDVGGGWSVGNINALQASIMRTHLNNLHSIPQDCPHREQRGWGGDAQLTAGSAALNLDMAAFYRNWVRTMKDTQSAGNGDLPSYVPREPDHGDKAPSWAAIAAVVPWEFMVRTGDQSMLQLGLNTTAQLINFWRQHLNPDSGLLDIVVYGDWNFSPREAPPHQFGVGASQPKLMSAHGTYIECLDRGIALAHTAEEHELVASWSAMAAKARLSFEKLWWNSTIGCYGTTCLGQTQQSVPLALNITTPVHMQQAVAGLVASVTGWNTSFVAGIIGTMQCPSLSSSQAPPSNHPAGGAHHWYNTMPDIDRIFQSRIPSVPTPAQLKLLQACDQMTFLSGVHYLLPLPP